MRAAAALTLGLTAFAAAQSSSSGRKVYTAEDLDEASPGAVANLDDRTKNSFCQAQFNTCRQLCDNSDETNDCENDTLEYDCTCSNGTAPGLQYYQATMPSLLCLEVFNRCKEASAGNSRDQAECDNVRERDCPEDGLLVASDGSSSDDGDDDDSSSSSSASSSAEETGASATGDADGSDATSDSSEESDDDDDNFAAPTAAPVMGAGAIAMAMLAWLL